MDCCKTKDKDGCCKDIELKGGKSMVEIKKNTMLWIVIGILVIATIFLTFKVSSIGTGAAQATGQVAKSVASSGMVGGC